MVSSVSSQRAAGLYSRRAAALAEQHKRGPRAEGGFNMLHSVAVIVESPGSLECSNAAMDGLLGVVLFGFLLFFKFISKSA